MKILFVSHTRLDSNSGNHINNLALQLEELGAECVVCVPEKNDEKETNVRVFSFSDALEVAKSENFDLIHAWTPREHVRIVTEQLVRKCQCPYFIHLEDNEETILEEFLGYPMSELQGLPQRYLDAIVPSHLSHPISYRKFISNAQGITVIMDTLLEFCPSDIPSEIIWPGFDDLRWQIPSDENLRRELGINDQEHVLVYTGNVHKANQQEVSSLYLAVGILNRKGIPTRLIRTGYNQIPLLSADMDNILRKYYLDIGWIPRGKMPALLSIADALVQPGTSNKFNEYRFPSKIPEYLASGKPVILPMTNIGRFMKDGEDCVLLSGGDALEISNKLTKLFKDKQLAKKIGLGGVRFANRELQWGKNAKVLYEFYNNALNDKVNIKKTSVLQETEQNVKLNEPSEILSEIDRRIAELEEDRFELEMEINERDAQLAERDAQLAERDVQLAERDVQLAEHDAELRNIKMSGAWRLIRIWRKIELKRDERLLRNSPLFDNDWYLSQNPDVAADGEITSTAHYLLHGGREGRDPSPYFSAQWYLDAYPDVQQAGINPLLHYLRHGEAEGRLPMEKEKAYLLQDKQESTSNTFLAAFRYFVDMFGHKIDVFGGIRPALGNIWKQIRHKGLRNYIKEFQMKYQSSRKNSSLSGQRSKLDFERLKIETFTVVPHYLNPHYTLSSNTSFNEIKIAVHYHIYDMENIQKCIPYLDNIPVSFDLLISIEAECDQNTLSQVLRDSLTHLKEIVIKKVPPCKESLAPLIIEFREEIQKYNFVANLDVDAVKHGSASGKEGIIDDALRSLFGSKNSIYQMLELLRTDGKIIYSASDDKELEFVSGWGNDAMLSERFLLKLFDEDIEKYPFIDFPKVPVFYVAASILKDLNSIPFTYSDFEVFDTVAPVQTQVLEKLLMVASNKMEGRNYRIHLSKNITRSPYYETQKDYSVSICENTPRVLSYYLPQFYPTPENDKWHGKGFTEWHKVRAASPLFYGHDQQRAPHDDLGYYSLATIDTLKTQLSLMKAAGIYGQIFYHYWFGGSKILERPAQMLLEDKSIDMPFSFCWANENWTQKWDGNEDEILLAQDYSGEDAKAFIEYLIPFFNDKRYIRIDDRPVLFIYRPSSIPDFYLYKRIWDDICSENGLPSPFVVAVLTRGASSPYDFGMDAGTERVLHDWTDGNVRDIRDSLYAYFQLNQSVLDYGDVANYYMSLNANRNFPYFRSIVPSWDNTPRYGANAHIIHNSTPEKFQEWFNMLVADVKNRLPKNQQFIIVNAWNEWAESDALEPDKKFGYAYLNSVGRALSGIDFHDREYLRQKIHSDLNIHLLMSDSLVEGLKNNEIQKQRIITCIANSTILPLVNLIIDQQELFDWLPVSCDIKKKTENEKLDYILHIDDLCYFSSDVIENMIKMAEFYEIAVITPSHANDEHFSHESMKPRWGADKVSSYLYLEKDSKNKTSVKCCVDANIFVSSLETTKTQKEKVSTVIRFHGSDSLYLLERALYSLLAQVDIRVQPIIMTQDLPDEKLYKLKEILDGMFWGAEYYPIVKQYKSTEKIPDLRSKMLNEGLRLVTDRYVAFLDYDDILFFDAYAWLIERLKKTGKSVTFGLIYHSIYSLSKREMLHRKSEKYGKTHASFIDNNLTPIHGIMLDISKVNLENIDFYDDMKYMEDYYMTLQIFSEYNTDWAALAEKKYIGDYFFYEDKVQTLGGITDAVRQKLILDPVYVQCQERIDKLRNRIKKNSV